MLECNFFISEGMIKADILKMLDRESIDFFETQGGGILCVIGEVIMNAFKTGHCAKIYLADHPEK